MLEMQGLGGLGGMGGLAGFQEKANCLPLPLNLNLTHYLTLPLAAGKNDQPYWAKGIFQEILYYSSPLILFAM